MNKLSTVGLTAVIAVGVMNAGNALAQTNAQRTNAIVASFNKKKHVVREKKGIRVEKYKEIRSEPAVLKNIRDYSGSYEAEGLGLSLDLQVDSQGNVTGKGNEAVDQDQRVFRAFSLRNARIDRALLTATKVYERGGTEPFEGVFINETSFESPTDKGVTTFGLGVIGHSVVLDGGVYIDRVFYQRK
ncbi:MAG: hypothetical protein ABR582_03575 [Gemmatimonadaceae bacterium]